MTPGFRKENKDESISVPSSVSGYRTFRMKRLHQRAEINRDHSFPGFIMNRSLSMNRSFPLFAALLLAIPSIGIAQPAQTAPQTNSAPQAAMPPSSRSTPSQTTPAAATTDKSDTAHYIIGPEDSLQITVWREPTLSGTVPVRPDGKISMVLLGDVQAAGLTPMKLSADITERLKKYIQDPSVSVIVLAVNSQRIFLIGEVGHAGAIPMTPGMTPLQAIAAAGGLTPFANSKHIYILRGTGASQQKIPFNYKDALKGDSKQDIALLPNDTIVVR
jgi:polysaccharide export outer membrane protein